MPTDDDIRRVVAILSKGATVVKGPHPHVSASIINDMNANSSSLITHVYGLVQHYGPDLQGITYVCISKDQLEILCDGIRKSSFGPKGKDPRIAWSVSMLIFGLHKPEDMKLSELPDETLIILGGH